MFEWIKIFKKFKEFKKLEKLQNIRLTCYDNMIE